MRLPRRRGRPRVSYRRAVEWIALNDDARDAEDLGTLSGYASVAIVADLWGKAAETVAADVLAYLNKGDR